MRYCDLRAAAALQCNGERSLAASSKVLHQHFQFKTHLFNFQSRSEFNFSTITN